MDKVEFVPPTDVTLPLPLTVIKLDSVRVRTLRISPAVKSETAIANFEAGVKKAWEVQNAGMRPV